MTQELDTCTRAVVENCERTSEAPDVVTTVGGQMVDKPVLERARRLLALATE